MYYYTKCETWVETINKEYNAKDHCEMGIINLDGPTVSKLYHSRSISLEKSEC
jgi:phosphopantothenoylcysteine synthetase/decarboxylase